jgi:hypothetical protein
VRLKILVGKVRRQKWRVFFKKKPRGHGCQLFLFHKPKIPIWVKFCKALEWRMLVCFEPFGIFYGHLVYFMANWLFWYISPPFWYIVSRKIWQPCAWYQKPSTGQMTKMVLDLSGSHLLNNSARNGPSSQKGLV